MDVAQVTKCTPSYGQDEAVLVFNMAAKRHFKLCTLLANMKERFSFNRGCICVTQVAK